MQITDYAAKTSPAPTDVLVLVDAEDTSQSAAGTTKKMLLRDIPTSWLDVTSSAWGAKGDDFTDDAPAIQSALNAAPKGAVVYAPPLTYLLGSQLTIPDGVWLVGSQGYRAAASNFTRFRASSTFTAASLITFAAGTPTGGMKYIALDGSLLPSGNTVDGIDIAGGAKQGSLIGITVKNFGGHGINIFSNTGGNPDGWYLHEISCANNGGHGVFWQYSVDSQLDIAHLDNNALSGLALLDLNNTTVSNVKAQQNTQYGYYILTAAGTQKAGSSFSLCYCENNGYDGWYVSGSGSNSGGITWLGCWTRDDGVSGTSGSGYSGWNVSLPGVDLAWIGCGNYLTTAASGPDHGVKLTGCTGGIVFSGCSLIGSVTPYDDAGGNSGIAWEATTLSSGQSSSRTSSAPRALAIPGPSLGLPKPSDFGALAQTYDYLASSTGTTGETPAAGVLVLAALPVPRPVTGSITLTFETTVAGVTPTTGQNLIGLYPAAGGAPVASAVIDSAVTAAAGPQSFTLTLTSPLLPGVYWVGLLFNAATVPTLRRAPVMGTSLLNYLAGTAQTRAGTYGSAQTALPALTPASINQVNYLVYVLAS